MEAKLKLSEIYNIYLKIIVETGLRIGTTSTLDVAGIDNLTIKDPRGFPYIPGSSLKGAIRSLIEMKEGKITPKEETIKDKKVIIGFPYDKESYDELIPTFFGFSNKGENRLYGPTRIYFSDFFVDENDTLEELKRRGVIPKTADKLYPADIIEVKTENMIDRFRGTAIHPRDNERVIPGVIFKGYITIILYEGSKDGKKWSDKDKLKDLIKELKYAFKLLEKIGLGISRSRGYGRVKVEIEKVTKINEEGIEETIKEGVISLDDLDRILPDKQ